MYLLIPNINVPWKPIRNVQARLENKKDTFLKLTLAFFLVISAELFILHFRIHYGFNIFIVITDVGQVVSKDSTCRG